MKDVPQELKRRSMPPRVCLNAHEAGIVHEALWQLHGGDDRFAVPAVQRLIDRVEKIAIPSEVLTDGRA